MAVCCKVLKNARQTGFREARPLIVTQAGLSVVNDLSQFFPIFQAQLRSCVVEEKMGDGPDSLFGELEAVPG